MSDAPVLPPSPRIERLRVLYARLDEIAAAPAAAKVEVNCGPPDDIGVGQLLGSGR